MTDPNELIAQSKSICEAATPGPWVFDFGADGIFRKDCDDVDDGVVAALDMYAKDDGEFIATARTLVPELSAALVAERSASDSQASDAKSLIRELRAHKAELTRERDEARREVADLKSQRTLFQNEAIESLHLKVNSLERDAVHHRREHQMVTEEHGKLKRERDEARAELAKVSSPGPMIDIVFDGPPSHESGRFVEVENEEGQSLSYGEWIERPDGYWALRFTSDWNTFQDATRRRALQKVPK